MIHTCTIRIRSIHRYTWTLRVGEGKRDSSLELLPWQMALLLRPRWTGAAYAYTGHRSSKLVNFPHRRPDIEDVLSWLMQDVDAVQQECIQLDTRLAHATIWLWLA